MGGNALKNCNTKRLDADDYFKLVDRVVRDILNTLGEDRRVSPIAAYKNKKDFGDADILIESGWLPSDWVNRLAHVWNSKETFSNGDVVSFEVDEFQVDIIKSKPEAFAFAQSYYAYNDLGNLLGRMAKKLGLKYGHDGLWYVFRDGDQVIENILITLDPGAIYDLLELDKRVVLDSPSRINDLEDIFTFVASSPYFNPDIYLLENLNHISRTRDRKRKTYTEFLKWCDTYKDAFGDVYKFNPTKETYLPFLFEFFARYNFKEKWSNALAKMLSARHTKTKFNGLIVHDVTNLTGKELGMFMTWFLNSTSKDYLLVMPDYQIRQDIKDKFEEWKKL